MSSIPQPILEQLKRSPRLRLVVDELQETLRREQEARRRFYDDLTEDSRAEFINGEVVVQSPAKMEHLDVVMRIASPLKAFLQVHGLGKVTTEKALIVLTRNDYEPDVCFWGKTKSAGFARDQLKFPAPDFVVEVLSPSTEATDRGLKMDDYAAHGVAEYWIVDCDAQTVEQYVLRGDRYELAMKSREGVLRSIAIEGFAMPVGAVVDEDENLAFLRKVIQ
jgi:Uma2 family endonuclease